MIHRLRDIRPVNFMFVALVMSLGCGAWETDPPGTPEPGDSSHESENKSSEVEEETVRHTFEPDGEGGDETSPDEGDPETENFDDDCSTICWKVVWCRDDAVELPDCVDVCEAASDGKTPFSPSMFECLVDAEQCPEIEACQTDVEVCNAICRETGQCSHFEERDACDQWCREAIWNGDVDDETEVCLEEVDDDDCPDLTSCGVSVTRG